MATAQGLYTLADLTAAEWTKIRPGLRKALERLNNARSVNIFDWKIQGFELPIFWLIPGYQLPIGGAALGLWYRHADGTIYTLNEEDLPKSWNGAQYIDYVVKLVKSPYVVEVGQIGEALGLPMFWKQHVRLRSVQEFIDRAYTRPVTIQPQPVEPPVVPPDTTQPPYYPPYQPYYPGGGTGEQQRTAGEVDWTKYIVWGAIGIAGIVVLSALMRPRPAPVRVRKRRKGGKR